jgi:hypothetical protein
MAIYASEPDKGAYEDALLEWGHGVEVKEGDGHAMLLPGVSWA